MSGGLFADVDRSLVMAALAEKLRLAGVAVPLTATVRATTAAGHVGAMSLDELYWLTRLSFISNRRDLATFDRLFDAVFDTDHRDRDRRPPRANRGASPRPGDEQHSVRLAVDHPAVDGGGVPWATLPSLSADAADETDDGESLSILDRLPAAGRIDPHKPFDLLDDDELARAGELVEASIHAWPRRLSRRRRLASTGDRPHLRAGLRQALRTGGEPLILPRSIRTTRARPITVLLDVSGSMEAFTRAYLHVARALSASGRAEAFAFATDATRITPSLRLRSSVEAIERASDDVGDRFSGTRLATSLRTVLGHRSWSSFVRGAVVVVVSDGWDTDPPEMLERQLARLRRTAQRIIWVNPRLAAADYEPTVAAMAVALPYCDHFLPGHSLSAMSDVLDAIAETPPLRGRSRNRGWRPRHT